MGKIASSSHVHYSPLIALTAYELAREGMSDPEIAKTIGVALSTFNAWKTRNTHLAEFLRRGREYKEGSKESTDYIFGRLSPECRMLWDKLTAASYCTNAEERAESIAMQGGKEQLQKLYIHALIKFRYCASDARRFVGISSKMVDNWCKDLDFQTLLREVLDGEKDFIQSKFLQAVEDMEPTVLIHAMKTKNRDRGYGEQITHKHEGRVDVAHADFPLDAVFARVSAGAKREMLAALDAIDRERETLSHTNNQPSLPAPRGEVIDVQVIPTSNGG